MGCRLKPALRAEQRIGQQAARIISGLHFGTASSHQIASFDAQVFIDQSLGQQIRRRIDQHDAGFAK
jgi:hypothetical protein